MFMRSEDGGATWSNETRLTNDAAYSRLTSVSTSSGSDVHIVWRQGTAEKGVQRIHYKRSTDRGETWDDERDVGGCWVALAMVTAPLPTNVPARSPARTP